MVSSAFRTVILASLVTVATTTQSDLTQPVKPSQDPWYKPPEGYEEEACGTILRSRPPPCSIKAFDTVNINLNSSHQILYRTTDARGYPQATVTTVLVPHAANMSRLVSYQDFEDSACPDCATSYAMQDPSLVTLLTKADTVVVGGALANGWVVAMPDYEGPKAATFSGKQCGQATLDGIRAVLNSQDITGIAPKKDVDVQMWGYSGGSIATEWAAELQPIYAPELKANLKAAIIGGAITNLTLTFLTINKGSSVGFAPTGVCGLMNSYPNILTDFLKSEIIESKQEEFFKPLTMCGILDLPEFQFQDVFTYFKKGVDIFRTPEIMSLINSDGVMGLHAVPEIPLYFYKGQRDEISPIADLDKLVDGFCEKGIGSLKYIRDSVSKHAAEHYLGCGSAIAYMKDRFNGITPEKGCSTENVFITKWDSSSMEGYGDEVRGIVEELLEQEVGTGGLKNIGTQIKNWFYGGW